MLRPVLAAAQEGAELDMGEVAARGSVRLVDHEGMAVRRLSPEKPTISVRAAIQLASLCHGIPLRSFRRTLHPPERDGTLDATGLDVCYRTQGREQTRTGRERRVTAKTRHSVRARYSAELALRQSGSPKRKTPRQRVS